MIEYPGSPNPAREGPQPSTTARGHLFEPHGRPGPGRGVLVLHAWWGLNQSALDFARRLADEGFTVFAPDLFDGNVVNTIEEAEAQVQRREGSEPLQVALEQSVLGAADWLVERTGGPIGAVGFSFGAAYALWLGRKRPENLRAIVVYYGTAGPIGGDAPVLGHFASDDPFEGPENVDDLENQLRDAGREGTIHRYPDTKHWFAEPDRPEHRPAAAATAWQRTVDFLRQRLGG